MEVVDATCVLDVQLGLQNRLKEREVERNQKNECSPGKD